MKQRTRSPSSDPDYVAIAKQYARDAIKGKKRYGKWIKLAAKRFEADIKHAGTKRPRFTFDPERANHACRFIELLPHIEGEWETPTIKLQPFQVFFVVQLFGFRNLSGGRRFNTALFAIARKNAKSTLAAGILLYCLCCDDEPGAQIISAATTGDQARIVWNVAKRMVEKTPALRSAFGVEAWANTIPRPESGGVFKPINAKASTQDGLNPSAVCLDELHAHKNYDLLNVLKSAAGARRNALWLYTTTEGYETPGPWPEQRHFAHQVLQGVVRADHFLAVIYAVDPDDDEFDEEAWYKANPLIDANPELLKKIRELALEAKQIKGGLSEFRIKRLNRQAQAADSWVDLHKWQQCSDPVDLEELRGVPCWGGLDLASTQDLAAFRLVWKVGDKLLTWGRRWVPGDAVDRRRERGTVPYPQWVEAGLIEQTEGNVTDYTVIEAAIVDAFEQFNLQMIAYDRWNATDLVSRLVDQGVPLIEFVQGPKSFHPAMQALERRYLSGQLAHGGDPVLQWCASNLVPRTDANLNMAPDRKRSADKIDDMVALIMATGLATNEEKEQTSVYETRGVLEMNLTEV